MKPVPLLPTPNSTDPWTANVQRVLNQLITYWNQGIDASTLRPNAITSDAIDWPLLAPNGKVSAPSYAWEDSPLTGFYGIGFNNVGLAINGTKLLDFSSALLGLTGAMTISSTLGVTGTSTLAAINMTGVLTSTNTTDATSINTGSIITDGGVGIEKALYVGGLANFASKVTIAGDASAGDLIFTRAATQIVPGSTSLAFNNNANNATNVTIADAGAVTIHRASLTVTTGGITVTGNSTITGTLGGITTLTATTLAGTLSTAAQGNVTSLGTLTGLTISGTLAVQGASVTLGSGSNDPDIKLFDSTQRLRIGGGSGADYDQGAAIFLHGNSEAINPGDLYLKAGTGGDVVLFVAATTALTLAVTTGACTLVSSLTTGAPTGGAGAWKLGIANAVSPTSPNRTITIDIGGTLYYLHAKTTND